MPSADFSKEWGDDEAAMRLQILKVLKPAKKEQKKERAIPKRQQRMAMAC